MGLPNLAQTIKRFEQKIRVLEVSKEDELRRLKEKQRQEYESRKQELEAEIERYRSALQANQELLECEEDVCSRCDGTGAITQRIYHNDSVRMTCPDCDGNGRCV